MKKIKKVKEPADVVQTPSKIVSVVFTIPTSFSYESVKVEMSGVADNTEIVGKYNELVELFRPKPKPATPAVIVPVAPVTPKESFKPYSVPRKVPPSDDEAGGAVIKEGKDEETISLQKQDIAILLEKNHDFICKGKSLEAISDKVKEITKLALVQDNYEKIIDALK